MTVYKGAAGIDQLLAKVKAQSATLMSQTAINVTEILIDPEVSPISLDVYPPGIAIYQQENSSHGNGQFINSWNTSVGEVEQVIRSGNPDGGDAYTSAAYSYSDILQNIGQSVYVTNTTPQAKFIEEQGWSKENFGERPWSDNVPGSKKWEDGPYAPVKRTAEGKHKPRLQAALKDAIKKAMAAGNGGDDAPF